MDSLLKREISEHWQYIGELGREWYLKRIRRDPIKYNIENWADLPFPIRSLLGRKMNERYTDTRGGHTINYVARNVVIGLNRYGDLLQRHIDNMTDLDIIKYESIADFERHLLSYIQRNTNRNDFYLLPAKAAIKVILGRNYRNRNRNKSGNAIIGTLLSGILTGLGGSATVKQLTPLMQAFGISPAMTKTSIASLIASPLIVAGTKKILELTRKGDQIITFINITKDNKDSMYTWQENQIAQLSGFNLGDEVITTRGIYGTINKLNGNTIEILTKERTIEPVSVSDVLKADDLIITKDGAITWDTLPHAERVQLLTKYNLPLEFRHTKWNNLTDNVKSIILKEDESNIKDDDEVKLEDDKKDKSTIDKRYHPDGVHTFADSTGRIHTVSYQRGKLYMNGVKNTQGLVLDLLDSMRRISPDIGRISDADYHKAVDFIDPVSSYFKSTVNKNIEYGYNSIDNVNVIQSEHPLQVGSTVEAIDRWGHTHTEKVGKLIAPGHYPAGSKWEYERVNKMNPLDKLEKSIIATCGD